MASKRASRKRKKRVGMIGNELLTRLWTGDIVYYEVAN